MRRRWFGLLGVGILLALTLAWRADQKARLAVKVGAAPASAVIPAASGTPGFGTGAPSGLPVVSGLVNAKLEILDAILASRNDNDPRLDTEFNDLSPEARAAFRAKYHALPLEKRSERGTVVYLLGRNLRDGDDVRFLGDVLRERPCLSLSDCSKRNRRNADDFVETTLAYPQWVAWKSVERLLKERGQELDPGLRAATAEVLRAAKGSPIRGLARQAAELEKELL